MLEQDQQLWCCGHSHQPCFTNGLRVVHLTLNGASELTSIHISEDKGGLAAFSNENQGVLNVSSLGGGALDFKRIWTHTRIIFMLLSY